MVFRSCRCACADLPFSDSIHNLGMVGHIEDIVVNKDQQGKKLGLRIIEALDYIAEKVGCYKVSPLVFYSLSTAVFSMWLLNWAGIRFNASRLCPVRCLDTLSHPFDPLRARCQTPHAPRLFPTTPTLHSTLPPPTQNRIISESCQADSVFARQFSTVPKRTRVSTSSAATRGSDWRWHTIMINDYQVLA